MDKQDMPRRKIYEKEQCNLCKRWLSANTLRWKHDCRKQEKAPRNKRPHLTSVPLFLDCPIALCQLCLGEDPIDVTRGAPTTGATSSPV